jgi:hypothetical protein
MGFAATALGADDSSRLGAALFAALRLVRVLVT